MVNTYGQWTVEKDYSTYPKSKWCDMDYVADYINKQNYIPETNIENLAHMVMAHFEADAGDYFSSHTDDLMINMDELSEFVEASGGLEEFDYYC